MPASPCPGDGRGGVAPGRVSSGHIPWKPTSCCPGLRRLHRTPALSPSLVPASKVSAAPKDDEDDDVDRLSELDAWAERMEGVWNDVLEADARGTKPRVTLPGFPIHVRQRGKRQCVKGYVDKLG